MSDSDAITRSSGPPAGRVYRFGGFELDPVRETLNGPDGPVLLRDQAIRVLKLLLERAPGVVSRDDILDEVWGHQALSESSIAQVIGDIRVALGDSARNPSMVATRYGRGYQFVGKVETVALDPTGSEPASQSPRVHGAAATSARKQQRLLVTMLLVSLIAVLAVTGWQWLRGAPTFPVADAEPITLRAVAPASGDALSDAFADYLAFLLSNALGSSRVDVAREDAEIDPAYRVIEVSLASLETGDKRQLELAIGPSVADDTEFRQRFDEASDMIRRGLDEVLRSAERDADAESRLDSGLVSQSSFAVETLLRGMAAQFAGDVQRAAELFEAALAEDSGFEFARYELAIAVRRNGEYERALAILEPMTERLDSAFWTYRINNAIGIAYWQLDRLDEAQAALRRSEAAAETPLNRAIVLTNIALLERNQGQLAQAEATAHEAIRETRTAESTKVEASARNTLASIQLRLGKIDEALVNLGLAREAFYEAGDLAGYGAVLSRTARIRAARGERAETESLLRLALGIREQIGDDDGVADIQLRLARIYRIRGEFGQARVLARNGLDRAQSLQEDDLVIDGYQAMAALALAEGRHDQARTYGNEALRLAEQTGRENDQRAIRHGLMLVDLESGAASRLELVTRSEMLIDDSDAADDRTVGIRARVFAARIYRELQRTDDARRVLTRAGDLLRDDDLRLKYEVDAERVRLALATEDMETAARLIDALKSANAPPHPLLMLEARLQAEQGDLTSAVEAAGYARAMVGDWWTAEDQVLLDRWSEANRR